MVKAASKTPRRAKPKPWNTRQPAAKKVARKTAAKVARKTVSKTATKTSRRPPQRPPSPATPPAKGGALPRGTSAVVRIYRHGLGDCILVRLKQANGKDFKMLIDCGVVLGTPNPAPIMTRVVEDVVSVTGGAIDVLAITHEHWDHLSGFNQAAESFKKLKVDDVWVAWTEDPNDDLAKTLKSELGKAEQALTASVERLRGMGANDTAALLPDLAATALGATGGGGGNSTKAAFDFAKSMASKTLRFLRPTDAPMPIGDTGARIYVLGPPHDPKLIRKINPSTRDPETYGLALNATGILPFGVVTALELDGGSDAGQPFHWRRQIPMDAARSEPFFKANYFEGEKWRRVDDDWLGSTADFALALQSYTNNTSLVLAVELGQPGSGDVLLFAGDAQVGNWESWQDCAWPQDNPTVTGPALLARTIFYKVGHHGSHNATLRQHGVDQMTALKSAVIPVDEVMAKKKHWGEMPLPKLIDALKAKIGDDNVLRTDVTPAQPPSAVIVEKDYFELSF